MRYHQKASFLPTLSIAIAVAVAIFFAFNGAFADTAGKGAVNGDGVVDERARDDGGSLEVDEKAEDGSESAVESIDSEGKTDLSEKEDEELGEPWYKKYWWILICPASVVFFVGGVGVYYLVRLIRRMR